MRADFEGFFRRKNEIVVDTDLAQFLPQLNSPYCIMNEDNVCVNSIDFRGGVTLQKCLVSRRRRMKIRKDFLYIRVAHARRLNYSARRRKLRACPRPPVTAQHTRRGRIHNFLLPTVSFPSHFPLPMILRHCPLFGYKSSFTFRTEVNTPERQIGMREIHMLPLWSRQV